MSDRYNTPERNTQDWHEPINENFENIGADISDLEDGLVEKLENIPIEESGELEGNAEEFNFEGATVSIIDGKATIEIEGGSTDGGSSGDYDVIVYEKDGTFYAEDRSGTTINSGSDGEDVLQAGIDEAPPSGIISVSGEYDISGTIVLGNSKKLSGYSAHFKNTSETIDPAIELSAGTADEDLESLESDIEKRSNHIQVTDVSKYEVGDLVRLLRDELWSIDDSGGQISELHKIWEIDEESDTLIISDSAKYDYPTTDNARVEHIKPDSATLEGITLTGLGQYEEQRGIEIEYSSNVKIRDVTVTDMGDSLIRVKDSYGTHVTDSRLERCNIDGEGYGIYIRMSSANTRITNCQLRNIRHCVEHSPSGSDGGMGRGTHVIGCEVKASQNSAAFDAHDGVIDWAIIGNDITGNNNNAIQSGARDTFIASNQFYGVEDDRDIEGGFYRTESSHSMANATLLIKNNHINNPGSNFAAIELRLGGGIEWKTVNVSGNSFIDCHDHALRLRTPVENFKFTNNLYDSEEIGTDSGRGLDIQGDECVIDSGLIANNVFRGTHRDPILQWDGSELNYVTISGNHAESFNSDGGNNFIKLYNTKNSVIQNNVAYDTESNIATGIHLLSDCESNLVKDNTVYSSSIDLSDAFIDEGTANLFTGNIYNDGSENFESADGDLYNSTEGIGFADLPDGETASKTVVVPDGQELTIYGWGAYTVPSGNSPSGLNVEMVEADGTTTSENTVWTEDPTGVASYQNDSGSPTVIRLRVNNQTGTDYTEDAGNDGVGSSFAFTIE